MKTPLHITLSTLLILSLSSPSFSQEDQVRPDKLYTMSGFGLSVPVGQSGSFMKPKFSTSIGVNLGIGNSGLFLYPKLSLHAFGYDNNIPDAKNNYQLQQARATTYLLNIALGYRKIIDKFAFYAFAGAGGGIILTPRIEVNQAANTALLNEKTNQIGIIEPGAGMEYNLGAISVFAEGSYMHGLGDVGNRPFNAIPLTFGIKPNLSRLFTRKK
jgi:hypothetical protein